jgi:hypothetical protein
MAYSKYPRGRPDLWMENMQQFSIMLLILLSLHCYYCRCGLPQDLPSAIYWVQYVITGIPENPQSWVSLSMPEAHKDLY